MKRPGSCRHRTMDKPQPYHPCPARADKDEVGGSSPPRPTSRNTLTAYPSDRPRASVMRQRAAPTTRSPGCARPAPDGRTAVSWRNSHARAAPERRTAELRPSLATRRLWRMIRGGNRRMTAAVTAGHQTRLRKFTSSTGPPPAQLTAGYPASGRSSGPTGPP
jgi:hypothetical protein